MKYFRYIKTVLRHKWFVFLACVDQALYWNDPVLIWRGIIHDWTKFLPVEFFAYTERFEGSGKGIWQEENLDPEVLAAYQVAWNHHQKRHDHHWQYWMLEYDDGRQIVLPMSNRAKAEMLADWRGAGRTYGNTDTRGWYMEHRDKMTLHPETRAWIEIHLRAEPTDVEVCLKLLNAMTEGRAK